MFLSGVIPTKVSKILRDTINSEWLKLLNFKMQIILNFETQFEKYYHLYKIIY